MAGATLSRRARRFVAAGAGFLVLWGLLSVRRTGRYPGVEAALFGFVFHTVFGKAYSLVPTYFDRALAWPLAPAVHLPLSVTGATALALGPWVPPTVADAGAVAWALGALLFVATMVWTVRGNLTGAETATGEANARRRPIDRAANAAVPVATAYLLAGAYEAVATRSGLPPLLSGYGPAASHLLAAGAATVLLFGVGFRLLPRFTVTHPPRALVAVVLPAGALAPGLIAAGLLGGPALRVGAALEVVAVLGFAAAVGAMLWRTDRDRVGFYGVGCGAVAGLVGVSLGAWFALGTRDPALVVAHYRLNLLGFLGLTVVGVAYQFYPPNVGRFRWSVDRTALASIGAIAGGLAVEVAGWVTGTTAAVTAGRGLALVGSLLYAALLFGAFHTRYGGRGR
jgi:hypothetical protein